MNKGFSLVELIVVIAIMAILVGVAVPVFTGYIDDSKKANDIKLVDEVTHALQIAHGAGVEIFVVEDQYAAGMEKPVGYIVLSADKLSNDGYVATGMFEEGKEDVLKKVLSSTFGADYATKLQLSYGGWDADTGSFYENAGSMVNSVDQMGSDVLKLLKDLGGYNLGGKGLMYDGNGNLILDTTYDWGFISGGSKATFQVLTQGYEDSEELLLSVADTVSKVPKNTFVTKWENPEGKDEQFGVADAGGGREHYSAARAAYNNCFANYVSEFGNTFELNGDDYEHERDEHVKQIKGYGEDALELVGSKLGDIGEHIGSFKTGTTFPQVVCDDVFKNSEAEYSFTSCDACKALLQEYKDSNRDRSDATNFYNVMVTSTTYEEGLYSGADLTEDGTVDVFDWMAKESQNFAELYKGINTCVKDKSAIAILVYYRDGRLVFDYTPVLD